MDGCSSRKLLTGTEAETVLGQLAQLGRGVLSGAAVTLDPVQGGQGQGGLGARLCVPQANVDSGM